MTNKKNWTCEVCGFNCWKETETKENGLTTCDCKNCVKVRSTIKGFYRDYARKEQQFKDLCETFKFTEKELKEMGKK